MVTAPPDLARAHLCLAAAGLALAGCFAALRWSREPLPPPPPPAAPPRPIDPNVASYEDLLRIPGVTPRLARGILARRARATLRDAGDLDAVPGIGSKTLEKLEPYLQLPAETAD